MDIGTMEKKLNSGQYQTMADFAADMLLVFRNAQQFNPPGTTPYLHAEACEAAFQKEWAKALVPQLEYAEKRALQGLLSRLKANTAVSGLFLVAVDPVALGIPHYHDMIPKADCRDLSMIESKLKTDKYGTVKAFTDDVSLMMGNARKFNAQDPVVLGLIDAFEKQYKKELSTVRHSINNALGDGAGSKRKGGGGGAGTAGPPKKAKV